MRSKAILSCLTAAAVTISPLGLNLLTGSVRADSDDLELTQIQDEKFRSVLAGPNYDLDQDGVLSKSERESVIFIACDSCEINSLSGIEAFPNLTTLYCERNNLQSLDLSNNLQLNNLYCSKNKLETLNLRKNENLVNMDCSHNNLRLLDISKNTSLKYLDCSYNELSTLNVNANTVLQNLICNSNKLTELSMASNSALYHLAARENPITSLNINSATPISNVFNVNELQDKGWYYLFEKTDEYNQEVYLDFGLDVVLQGYTIPARTPFLKISEENFPDPVFREYVTQFDYDEDGSFTQGELDSVTSINCDDMNIGSLEGIGYFQKLTSLECYNNQIENLDLSGNPFLKWLYCWDNPLTDINLTNNPELVYLDLSNSRLEQLELRNNTKLECLIVYKCPLESLDLSYNTNLIYLNTTLTYLPSIDIRNCALYNAIDIDSIQHQGAFFTFYYETEEGEYYNLEIDITTTLEGFELANVNPILEINEENFPDEVFRNYLANDFDVDKDGFFSQVELDSVDNLVCDYMDIYSLAGIEYFTKLNSLSCVSTGISQLDLSANTELQSLWIADSSITELDLTNNPDLHLLSINQVPITSLDLSQNENLTHLYLQGTEITSIDIRNCSTFMKTFTVDKLLDKAMYYEYSYTETIELTCYFLIDKSISLVGYVMPVPVQVVEINDSNFPDENFREYVKLFDYDGDNWFSQPELDSISMLSCSYGEIVSLAGISFFTNLENLTCSSNYIEDVDLTQNTKLRTLLIYDNPVQSLNLSANTELVELDVQRCPLTELNVDSNKKLMHLDTRETQIENLDIQNCDALMSVFNQDELEDKGSCFSFEKTTEDEDYYVLLFDKVTNLVGFDLPAPVEVVTIDETSFPDPIFRDYISSFDYDKNGSLSQGELNSVQDIYCAYEGIFNLTGIEYFTEVLNLNCVGNFIEELDVSALTKLEYLNISGNPIASIDISANQALKCFSAANCPLADLNLDINAEIRVLELLGTEITSLDLSGCTGLVGLFDVEEIEDRGSYFYFEKYDEDADVIYTFSIGKNTTLIGYELPQPVDIVEISEETFPDPVFREFVKQYDFDKSEGFSQIELNYVDFLDCSYRQIENLKGIEYFTNLEYLDVSNCELRELHLEKNTKLVSLYCYYNHLKALDLSNNAMLNNVNVTDNLLSKLDISLCPNLVYLCSNTEVIEYDSSYFFGMQGEDYEYYSLGFDKRTELVGFDLPTVYALDVDETNFPDPNFCSYVSVFDTDGNAWLSQSELDNVLYIETIDDGIQSMKGIEYFPNLISLHTEKNPLTELDLSNNTKLKSLYISEAKITELDLSQNTAMFELSCNMTPVSTLDLGENPALNSLMISLDSKLTGLDLSECPSLTRLDCFGNNLSSLDLTNNTELVYLNCSDNKLSSLNVQNCPNLQDLACYNNNISTLDVSQNSFLKTLQCNKNALTSLDIGNNMHLSILSVQDNAIPSLKIYACPNLVTAYTEAEVMDYGTYYEYELSEYETRYFCLSVGKNTEIIAIDPVLKPLVEINETNFPDPVFREYVKQFDVSSDGWFSQTELDNIETVVCNYSNIASLKGIQYFASLKKLHCVGNKLQALDVSGNTALVELFCEGNSISALDLKNNTKLEILKVSDNQLAELNVSMLPLLTSLSCANNQIDELFLGNNVNLEVLLCSGNELISLNVSKNTKLKHLELQNNKITSLNVQSCPILVSLITKIKPQTQYGYRVISGEVEGTESLVVDALLSLDMSVELIPKSPFITPTPTNSPTPTKKPTPTPTKKVTPTPTKKATPTPTKKATPTPTKKATPTPTKKATPTPTKKATPTPTKKATPTPTKKTTPTPTKKATPTPTKKATPTPTKKATPTPTKKATPTPTKKATPTPTKKATPTPTKKATPTPTKKATPTPTKKATPTPTKKATPTPTKKATPTPTKKATPTPTKKATPTPTKKATPTPTKKATPTPTKKATPTPTKKATPTPTKAPSFEDFVERLYVVALNRSSDPSGKDYWVKQVQSKAKTGGDCARFFLLDAPEFMNRNLSVEDFVETLYKTFFDRASDPAGKKGWADAIRSGMKTRAEVVNDFIESDEWVDVCAVYGVESGAKYHFGTHPSFWYAPQKKKDLT